MEYFELSATLRTETGNGPARRLRTEGRCPAILYGVKTEPVMMAVNVHEFELSMKSGGSMTFYNLSIQGQDGGKRLAMIKEIQRDPVKGAVLHADFYEIDMERKLTVKVPVHAMGKCQGVELGGLLQVIRRELEISCLPSSIPAAIEIDISNLGVGETVHVEDIQLPEGIEIPHDVNFTVITVLSPKKETVEGAEEAVAEASDTTE